MYKILALNCLVSAYMMSALYLRGLKQGDTQMTASGLVVAALFFLLSQVDSFFSHYLIRTALSAIWFDRLNRYKLLAIRDQPAVSLLHP